LIKYVNPSDGSLIGASMADSVRRPSKKLSFQDAREIWIRLKRGEFQNRIAADYDVNPGRISEIRNGHVHHGSEQASML